jgi:hypothetical protein
MRHRSWLTVLVTLTLGLNAIPCAGSEPEPIRPQAVLSLFNGKDLTGLTTWLKDTKREDPNKVFTVHDGMIHVSGTSNGYVATEKAYQDYHVIVEYKWGKRTDGGKYVRNSGILLHAVGPDGGANGTWMSSIECQLAQGCVGDLIVIRGQDAKGAVIPVTLASEVVLGPDKRPRWQKGGERRVFPKGQLWWSQHDPDFKELLDTRGKYDVESPLGEWTKVECICAGKQITVLVNGIVVNACSDVFVPAGKILLQSEGFEIFFRRFELHPLKRGEGQP